MEQRDGYTVLPARDNHNCFGCSQSNEAGLRMRFYTDGESLLSDIVVPGHLCGWGNIVHGGIQSTILDEIMGWTALHLLQKFTLTKTMTVRFLRPVYVGEALRAEGRIKSLTHPREAILEAFLSNGKGKVCTRAQGTFGLFTKEAMRKLKVLDESVLESVSSLVAD